jgi:hypothetical protein
MKRLFEDATMYAEGRSRPFFRGKIHLACCLTIFPVFVYFYWKATEHNNLARIVGLTNLLIIYVAHCISAYYHMIDMPLEKEILLQKMDIIGANWYVGSSLYPMALLSFPPISGIFLALLATAITSYNSYCIWTSTYSVFQILFIIGLQIPFFYYIYKHLNTFEITSNFLGLATLGIASIFFIHDICPFDKTVFSHFEIYHTLSVVCIITTCLMNYSIVSRA